MPVSITQACTWCRPIIVYADDTVRNSDGFIEWRFPPNEGSLETCFVACNSFHLCVLGMTGVYLPLLWPQEDCIKEPLAFTFCSSHFSAFVGIESKKLNPAEIFVEKKPTPSTTPSVVTSTGSSSASGTTAVSESGSVSGQTTVAVGSTTSDTAKPKEGEEEEAEDDDEIMKAIALSVGSEGSSTTESASTSSSSASKDTTTASPSEMDTTTDEKSSSQEMPPVPTVVVTPPTTSETTDVSMTTKAETVDVTMSTTDNKTEGKQESQEQKEILDITYFPIVTHENVMLHAHFSEPEINQISLTLSEKDAEKKSKLASRQLLDQWLNLSEIETSKGKVLCVKQTALVRSCDSILAFLSTSLCV